MQDINEHKKIMHCYSAVECLISHFTFICCAVPLILLMNGISRLFSSNLLLTSNINGKSQ